MIRNTVNMYVCVWKEEEALRGEGGFGYLWRQQTGRDSEVEVKVDSVVWQGCHCTQGISEMVSPKTGSYKAF